MIPSDPGKVAMLTQRLAKERMWSSRRETALRYAMSSLNDGRGEDYAVWSKSVYYYDKNKEYLLSAVPDFDWELEPVSWKFSSDKFAADILVDKVIQERVESLSLNKSTKDIKT